MKLYRIKDNSFKFIANKVVYKGDMQRIVQVMRAYGIPEINIEDGIVYMVMHKEHVAEYGKRGTILSTRALYVE